MLLTKNGPASSDTLSDLLLPRVKPLVSEIEKLCSDVSALVRERLFELFPHSKLVVSPTTYFPTFIKNNSPQSV